MGVGGWFYLKGDVNAWVCEKGEWIKYGEPTEGVPVSPCTKTDELKGKVLSKLDETRAKSTLLNTADYSGEGLAKFPIEVLKKTDTKVLKLSNNSLRSLPAEIGQLLNLEELYVDHNQLNGALPAEIRKMTGLKIIDASDNNLTGIPAEIGQMKNLLRLDLSNNNLDAFPLEIYNIKDNLKVLNLFGNKYSDEQIIKLQGEMYNTRINF